MDGIELARRILDYDNIGVVGTMDNDLVLCLSNEINEEELAQAAYMAANELEESE